MPITKTANFILQVVSFPDFTLTLPSVSGLAFAGQVFPILANVTPIDQFAGEIVFSISGHPAGSVVTFIPSNTLTIAPGISKGIQINIAIAADNSLVGTYTIVVMAVSTIYNGG